MKNLIYSIIGILFLFSILSCDKELNILDDYKDITIVYGLINPNDSISYIRIEKAFLANGDIFEAAQVQDSNQFPYKFEVKLLQGNQIITFDTITIFNKDEGIFYAPKMLVYYAETKNLLNIHDSLYLEIFNPKTKEHFSSSSMLHNGNSIRFIYPKMNISFEKGHSIEFKSIPNTRLYNLNIRFHYMEQNALTQSGKTYKYIDWTFPEQITINSEGDELITFPYNGDSFYNILKSKIPETKVLERFYGPVDLILSSGDNILRTYINVNKPSNSLVIDRQQFTNIKNGYGVFAARSRAGGYYNLSLGTKINIIGLPGLNFTGGIPEN